MLLHAKRERLRKGCRLSTSSCTPLIAIERSSFVLVSEPIRVGCVIGRNLNNHANDETVPAVRKAFSMGTQCAFQLAGQVANRSIYFRKIRADVKGRQCDMINCRVKCLTDWIY